MEVAADDFDEEGRSYQLEHEALCHVTRHVFGAGFNSAEPGVLLQLDEDPCWKRDTASLAPSANGAHSTPEICCGILTATMKESGGSSTPDPLVRRIAASGPLSSARAAQS